MGHIRRVIIITNVNNIAFYAVLRHLALIYGQPSAVDKYVSVGTLLHTHTQQIINSRRKWQHKCSYVGMIGLL